MFTAPNISDHVSEKFDTKNDDVPAEGKEIIDVSTLKRMRYDMPNGFNLDKVLKGKYKDACIHSSPT